MAGTRPFPHPITILMFAIVIAAGCTWLLPAGVYDKLKVSGDQFELTTQHGPVTLPLTQRTLDSLGLVIPLEKFTSGAIFKPVSVNGTYHTVETSRQGIIEILMAPVKGVYEAIDIIFMILVVGGFINLFNETGALMAGVKNLAWRMRGRETWLIVILTSLFALGGASYGMAEEGLAFYPVLVPLFLAAGYDLLVPVAVIYGGTSIGNLSSFTNPFATIIASNAAGITWTDGLTERIVIFFIGTALTIWYIVAYARKVRANPEASLVYRLAGKVVSPYPSVEPASGEVPRVGWQNALLLMVFGATFAIMITGVVAYDWWLTEMTALFVASSLLIGVMTRMNETIFVQRFMKGAEMLLIAAFIVGVARGITIILNDGKVSDSILYYAAGFVGHYPAELFILLLLGLYVVLTIFISSSSGMAVLTMPILGALAVIVNVPGREIVNSYLFGMGIMSFITPTGLILPSLAMANINLKIWWAFIRKLLVLLIIVCAATLVIGLYL